MRLKYIFSSIIGFITYVASTSIGATLITYEYVASGNGGTVTGTFGYEDSISDIIPGEPTAGVYPGAGFYEGTISGGPQDGLVFDITNQEILIYDDYLASTTPTEYIDAFVIGDSGTLTFVEYFLKSISIPNPPLSSDQLASQDLINALSSLSSWEAAKLTVFDGEDQYSYSFASVSRSVSQVPEPTTFVLLSLGLVGLSITRRRMKAYI
jgi:hypothetical protein